MKISLNQLSLIGLGFLMCTAGHRVVAKNKKSEQNIKNCLTMLVRCDIIFFVVEVWLSLVEYFVRDTILSNSLVISRTPTNLLTPPLYGDLKNKIHVVKSVLTTCYPTDTGI